jgi:TalC/MipB family fructose-6-phosphate aldolase
MDRTVDFEALVLAMGDAVIGAGTDGAIVLWNPAAERMFGFTAEEALGGSLDLIIPERFRNRHWNGYQEVMRTGRTKIAKNVVVKCPVTKDGLKAIKHLSGEGIRGNHTLCFSATQALLSAKAGAAYISPFLGRLDDIGAVGTDLVRDICEIYRNYGFTTQVLAASIRSPLHVIDAAKAGAHVTTMPFSVLEMLMKHPLTDSGLSKFLNDWNKSGAEILSYSRATESGHRERSSSTRTFYVANASGDWS